MRRFFWRGLFGGLRFGGRLRERHAAGGRAPGKLRPQGGVRRDFRPGLGKAASRARRASSGAPSAQAERRGAFGQKRVSLPGVRVAGRRSGFGHAFGRRGAVRRFGPMMRRSCSQTGRLRAGRSDSRGLRPPGEHGFVRGGGAIMRKAAASASSWNAGDQNSSGLQIPPRSRSRNSLLRMTKYTTSMMTPVMIHETG